MSLRIDSNGTKVLPQTPEDFDVFVEEIVAEFDLPKTEQTELTIAQVIYNAPNGEAFLTKQYIANQVYKSIANDVVARKLNSYHLKLKAQAAAKQGVTQPESTVNGPAEVQTTEG